jgi:serine/threonine-protein kinase RsbW
MVFDRVMTPANHSSVVRLEFFSAFEMLDLVETVCECLGRSTGLDEDALHWVTVATRECVVNAIKHGNRNDPSKHVFVEIASFRTGTVPELVIRVRDQGEGFEPEEVADPLDPENILRSSGRGIFLIRSFMDDVQLLKSPQGGMEILMVKRAQPATTHDDSVKA